MSLWCLHSHRGWVMYFGVPGCVWGQCLVVQCQVSACGKGNFSVIFQHCSTKYIRSCLGRCLSVNRGKHQRILIIEQDGQLMAQYPGQPCGSVSVEFLRAWSAASPATKHLVLSGYSKVGEVGQNSWCTVRTEEGNFSRLVVRTSAK